MGALAGCLLLASCAAPPRQPAALSPGQLFKGDYIEVRAPNSDGWRLMGSSSKGMSFGKQARAPGETLGAQLLIFDLQPAETPEQFVSLIKTSIAQGTNPDRFDTVRSSSEYTSERGYPCVRHVGAYDDKQARTSPTTTDRLLLEVHALYCRHPVRTSTGFAAVYSHRGRSAYPRLAEEAQDYIQGVRVP
jgi:hypothetical protein